MIVCCCGPQRSGKTLMASMIASSYHRRGIEVFTNMECDDFIHIDSLEDMIEHLLDIDKQKILLLDEAHSLFNSRSFKNFADEQSLFFNILGKCRCVLIITTINPSMIDKVIREQIDFLFLARGDEQFLNYRMIDCHLGHFHDFRIEKTDLFWKSVSGLYDTTQVPDIISLQLSQKNGESFNDRIKKARQERKTPFTGDKKETA